MHRDVTNLDYKLPRFKVGKTQKDYRMARLIDINVVIDNINDVLTEILGNIAIGSGTPQSLEQTLNEGNTSGANDIILSESQALEFEGVDVIGESASILVDDIYFFLKVGSKVYATDYNQTIYVFDEDLTTLLTTHVNVPNYTLSYNAALNRIYVGTYSNSGTMHYIDNATDTLVTVNNGHLGGSDYIQYSTFDNHVYGYDYYAQAISKYDADLNFVSSTLVTDHNGYSLYVNQANGDIWLSNRSNLTFEQEIVVFNNALVEVARHVEVGTFGNREGIAQIGNKIYTPGGDTTNLLIFDATTRLKIGTLPGTTTGGIITGVPGSGKATFSSFIDGIYDIDSVNDVVIPIYTSVPIPTWASYFDDVYYANSGDDTAIIKIESIATSQRIVSGIPTGNHEHELQAKSGILAHLDNLQLSIVGQYLSIAGGNTVTLPGGNTWDIDTVAFVSATGNDGTAVTGDGNKPYQSIATALAASTKVIILPGIYNEITYVNVDNVEIYAMDGVYFNNSFNNNYCFNISSGAITKFTLRGHAKFIQQAALLRAHVQGGVCIADVTLEFDYIDSDYYLFFITGSTNLKISSKYMRTLANNTGGNAFSCRDSANVLINLEENLTISRAIFLRNGDLSNYIGKVIINCKNIIMDNRFPAGTGYGTVFYTGGAGAFYIEVNANIIHASGQAGVAIFYQDNSGTGSTVKIKGNLYSATSTLMLQYKDQGYLELEGSIYSPVGSPLTLEGADITGARVLFKNCMVEGLLPITIGAGRLAEFVNSSINIKDAAATAVISVSAVGTTVSKIKGYNSLFRNENGAGVLIGGTPTTSPETDSVGTTSNVANKVGFTDNWEGVLVVPTLTLPALIIPEYIS